MHVIFNRILFCLCCVLSFAGLTNLAAEQQAEFSVGEFKFQRPAQWEWIPVTSPMRKAQLNVAGAASGEGAEVVFFAGFGGGVEANIGRWFAQFEGSKEKIHGRTETVTVGNRSVTYALAEGTYLSGMPGGQKKPMANYALLAAILPSSQGDVFIKMTGPAELVKRSSEAFRKMTEGALK